MRTTLRLGLLITATLAGCGGKSKGTETPPENTATASGSATAGQSHADAMKLICDAPEACNCMDSDAAQKATALANWITERLTNEEVKTFFSSMGGTAVEQRPKLYEAELAKAGIAPESCVFYTGIVAAPR